ncbi:hypothetical protein A3K73_03540 [Candidatus Pacearchaeota archaeon RBG_13_36_9]|nr:MAG: hypothetical protein A3K73_03540 [Candidatus Pacearchaeota archaeon RBG_13_36_9]
MGGDYEIIVGGGVREYGLQAERGWDRYDSLDKKNCLRIADITEKSIYLGFRGSSERNSAKGGFCPTLKIGYNFYDFDVKEKDVVIDKKDRSFFVSLGAERLF